MIINKITYAIIIVIIIFIVIIFKIMINFCLMTDVNKCLKALFSVYL